MVKEQQQAAVKTVKTFFGQILALLQKKYSVQFALSCSYATINNSSLQIWPLSPKWHVMSVQSSLYIQCILCITRACLRLTNVLLLSCTKNEPSCESCMSQQMGGGELRSPSRPFSFLPTLESKDLLHRRWGKKKNNSLKHLESLSLVGGDSG